MKRSCFLLAVIVLSSACRSAKEDPAAALAPETPAALEVVPVLSRKLEATELLSAEITPFEMVAVFPRASGFVEEMLVDRGARVSRGDLLARLSAPELSSQRAEAESKALAARSTVERTRAAAETPGAVAKHDLELEEAVLKADEARVQSLRTLESYLVVRAPFDGVVTERNVHPGALVGPPSGTNAVPMLRIDQIKHLRVTVAVPEADVGTINEGAKAEFQVRAWPGQRFSGTIRRVAHAIEPRNRTMPVELDVENSNGKLAPGMYAEVYWPIRREGPSLLVPASAIAQTTERTFVDRVRDGAVEQVSVQRGVPFKDRVEVYGALQAGDLVLSRGSEELRSGAKVQTRLATPSDGGSK